MNQDQAYQLIAKKMAGHLSPEEATALETWRGSNQENDRLYRGCLLVWQDMHPGETSVAFDQDAAWQALAQKLTSAEAPAISPVETPLPTTLPFPRRKLLWVPWALAALLVLGFLGIYYFQSGSWREIQTASGQKHQFTWPDGTAVTLHAGSQLRWRKNFSGKHREVFLEGQGYFQVRSGEKPFVVRTANAAVQVIGTGFDVWARGGKTRVRVVEGKVAVSHARNNTVVYLNGGQQTWVGDGRIQAPTVADTAEILAWMADKITFKDQKLEDVILDLESLFGVDIRLTDPDLGQLKVNASFQDASLESVLSDICLALNLRYARQGKSYVISR